MNKEKIIQIIKGRIKATEEQLNLETSLYASDKRYAVPDYSYADGRIKAFDEALELIGMLDKENNK